LKVMSKSGQRIRGFKRLQQSWTWLQVWVN